MSSKDKKKLSSRLSKYFVNQDLDYWDSFGFAPIKIRTLFFRELITDLFFDRDKEGIMYGQISEGI